MTHLKLSELVDHMDMQFDESTIYYDRRKQELVTCFDGMATNDEDPEEIAEDEERYEPIPDRFEIHEYNIMEHYALATPGRAGDELQNAIKGSGAFRYFKDTLERFELRDDWYDYKQQALARIARDWCQVNEIEFIDDVGERKSSEPKQPSKDDIDWDKVDQTALALMHLTTRGGRTWKSYDWGITDRLHEKGYISDPKSKAKSFRISEEGEQLSKELFYSMFSKD